MARKVGSLEDVEEISLERMMGGGEGIEEEAVEADGIVEISKGREKTNCTNDWRC